MNLLELATGLVKGKGARAFGAWVVLAAATALAYRLFGEKPLEKVELAGMGLAWAVVVLAVSGVAGWLARRGGSAAPAGAQARDGEEGRGDGTRS